MNPFLVVRATIVRHRRGTPISCSSCWVAVATAQLGSDHHHPGSGAAHRQRARRRQVRPHGGGAPAAIPDVLLAAIYLRPGTVPLLDPAMVGKLLAEPRAKIFRRRSASATTFAALPIVGTVPGFSFVDYLSGGLR